MSDSDMFVQSLRNRIRAMNTIWERAIGDMTLDQVNHHEREGVLPLHVGIHAGDVIEEDGNVFGGAVNIAARVAAESAPGEVLVSQTVRDLARTSAGVEFEDAGERTLKGVGEPVRVWRVHRA